MEKEFTPDDIKALSTGEAIRLRPHLYFEKCFAEKTLDSLPFEVLCHAFDEYFDAWCTNIEISIASDSFTVHYNAGISLEIKQDEISKAELIMTQLFACKNEKKHLAVGEEFCSLGIATINFASEICELTTVYQNMKGHFIFKNGITQSRSIEAAAGQDEFTQIFVKPDKAIFPQMPFTFEGIDEKAKQIQSKLRGLEITIYNDIVKD